MALTTSRSAELRIRLLCSYFLKPLADDAEVYSCQGALGEDEIAIGLGLGLASLAGLDVHEHEFSAGDSGAGLIGDGTGDRAGEALAGEACGHEGREENDRDSSRHVIRLPDGCHVITIATRVFRSLGPSLLTVLSC